MSKFIQNRIDFTLHRSIVVGLAMLALYAPSTWAGDSFDKLVTVVAYDDGDAKIYGNLPPRDLTAKLVEKINAAEPRAVALKFFYDVAKDAPVDEQLAKAVKDSDAILQASISEDPPVSSELDQRFQLGPVPFHIVIEGNTGWLPTPLLQKSASSVCFVNIDRVQRVPIYERFNGKPVGTMYGCVLSAAYGALQVYSPDTVCFGSRAVKVDSDGEIAVALKDTTLPRTLSFRDVLSGAASAKEFAGKVVVVVYMTSTSPSIEIGGKNMPIHQAFLAEVREVMDTAGSCPNQ